jgi:hypothetical protein
MALTLKPEFAVKIDAQSIYVTDKTGEYAADNTGGWGAPNQNQYESCIVCLVVAKKSDGDVLFTSISPTVPYVYDDTVLNDFERTFQIKYITDSVLEVYLVRLPATIDQINFVDTGVIAEGNYFYYNGFIYKRVAGNDVLLEDYLELITASSPGLVRGMCSDAVTAQLALKRQALYKEYRIEREKDCDDAEPLAKEIDYLDMDLQGLYYAFACDLKIEAQNQIEDLLDKFEIKPNE